MIIATSFGRDKLANCRLALNAAWFFCFFIEVRLLTLPLAYPNMGYEGIAACFLLAICLYVWVQAEARSVIRHGLDKFARYDCMDKSRPALSWFVLLGSIGSGGACAYALGEFAAHVAPLVGW